MMAKEGEERTNFCSLRASLAISIQRKQTRNPDMRGGPAKEMEDSASRRLCANTYNGTPMNARKPAPRHSKIG